MSFRPLGMYYLPTYVMYAVQTVVGSQSLSPQGQFEKIFYRQATSYKLAFIHSLFVSRYKILVNLAATVTRQ